MRRRFQQHDLADHRMSPWPYDQFHRLRGVAQPSEVQHYGARRHGSESEPAVVRGQDGVDHSRVAYQHDLDLTQRAARIIDDGALELVKRNRRGRRRLSCESRTGKDCLSQLATTLPDSELKNSIQSFVKKHKND